MAARACPRPESGSDKIEELEQARLYCAHWETTYNRKITQPEVPSELLSINEWVPVSPDPTETSQYIGEGKEEAQEAILARHECVELHL